MENNENNYHYLDPDFKYSGKIGLLYNLANIQLEKGLKLNLNPPDNKSVYKRYMKGTIESDVNLLKQLILELIENKNSS